jgi:hypothetical protein
MKIAIHSLIKDPYKPYLIEWLNYHRSIGVDHFFIYDNESEPGIVELVKDLPFRNEISVEMINGGGSLVPNVQINSYAKFLSDLKYLPHYDRVAFIDEDEFIICKNGDLKSTLENYINYPGIGISWRMFGSSGLLTRTPEPQMKKFTKYTGAYYHSNINIKSIVNPYLVSTIRSPHSFSFHYGNLVNEHKIPIELHYSYPSYDYLWINHYWLRSKEEWIVKANRGQVTGEKRNLLWFEDVEKNCTESI